MPEATNCIHQFKVSNGDGTWTCLQCHEKVILVQTEEFQRYYIQAEEMPIVKTFLAENIH
jgi:hypothetical protein